jgi:hypothetical protein
VEENMSETDIYKQRERVQMTAEDPRFRKARRRRRTSSRRGFDERDHRRRSKNSGLRRMLHLTRKSENERYFWWSILTAVIVLLVLVGLWQFWYLDYVAKKQSLETEYSRPTYSIPKSDSAAE